MIKIQKLKISLVACLLFLVALPVFAAEIVVSSGSQETGVGQQLEIGVFLNAESENINAIEGKVVFPADLLDVKEMRDGNSIINFWVDKPRIDTNINTNKHEIIFAGITPGGYSGEKGLIFSVIFRAKKEGEALIEISGVKALLGDSRGTETKTASKNLLVSIRDDISVPSWMSPRDIEPPESFKPEVARDPAIFDGKWFLVFATQDKGSGLDRYEIREGFWGEFRPAQSPYLLQNQNLDKKIFVKAVDKSGNVRIEVFRPPRLRPWYKNYSILIILIVGIAFLYFIRRILWKK